ncbi:hypothetical protein B0I27_101353 [Arcticibacter pallidicorallinus]|uniref:Acyl carrier protein phosphodiesterase n=1 Tax=Arcticibacter pallidicorallinus TaxID=1259464 RepID=A0A2T0UBW8_9SPHI|nr:hypothetical protein [Arcticibacter pallidicorallinus]PRY55384.1 hypothetical protein B0I27_101353 [Arcticibacter pallidicorallinus]
MNFLSHFYFDRDEENPYRIMGIVLPDLLKNANKEWNLRPEKNEHLFLHDDSQRGLLEGWKRHLEVDRYFHSSEFFRRHTSILRLQIVPHLLHSNVRPSFVAHIALELMLDSLLLTELNLNSSRFYTQLTNADEDMLDNFLLLNNIPEPSTFFNFLEGFIRSKYLESYREPKDIMYAIGKICQRIWPQPFTDEEKFRIATILTAYLEVLKEDFITIFNQIEVRLLPYAAK